MEPGNDDVFFILLILLSVFNAVVKGKPMGIFLCVDAQTFFNRAFSLLFSH